MEIEIPSVPLGVLTLLAFFSPYASAILNGLLSFVTNAFARRAVSIVLALALTAVVLLFYYNITGDVIESWWLFALLSIAVAQASYSLLLKQSSKKVEAATESAAAPKIVE